MIKWIKSKIRLKTDTSSDEDYEKCIKDLIQHEMVRSMKNYKQHGDTNCLEHSLSVSYNSYLICRRLGLDYRSAARGGLLHDFFLYDWHISKPQTGLHGFVHPKIALQNAKKYFNLNDREKDIIEKHMWPLTLNLPRYLEVFIVLSVDKYCAFIETIKYDRMKNVKRLKEKFEL